MTCKRPLVWSVPWWVVVLSFALSATGCATSDYRAARDACAAQWFDKVPPEHETRQVTRYRYEDIPDGTETCTVERIRDSSEPDRVIYTTKRTCVPNTKRAKVAYRILVNVDLRKEQRDAAIRVCVAQSCRASHGNPDCRA